MAIPNETIMYPIEIVRIRTHKDAVYIGRPSPLGNPFPITKSQSRDAVCDLYDQWFSQRVAESDPAIMQELNRLHQLGKQRGILKLGCFCSPYRCHGETIKEYLEQNHEVLESLI
jgi:hypothetical protein